MLLFLICLMKSLYHNTLKQSLKLLVHNPLNHIGGSSGTPSCQLNIVYFSRIGYNLPFAALYWLF